MLLAAGDASAARPTCSSLAPLSTVIEVIIEEPDEPAIRTTTAEDIRRQGSRSYHREHGEMDARGLTVSELQATVHYELLERTLVGGGRCVALSKVAARFAIPMLTIHIDRRYVTGSCEYRAILDHEQEHAGITRDTLKRSQNDLRQQLESAVMSWRDRWFTQSAQQQIKTAVNQALAGLVQQVQEDADRQHAIIDTPAAYEAVRRRCTGW
jgi:hypothetical protein